MPLGVECCTTLSAATTQPALPSVKSLASGLTFYLVKISDHFFGLRTISLTSSSGKSCPRPGEVPHGRWTCEVEDTPIVGTSFLDGEAQTYPGSEIDICAKKLHFCFQLFNAVYTVNLAMSLIAIQW